MQSNGTQPDLDSSVENPRDDVFISVRGLLEVLRRRLWVIVLVIILVTGFVVGIDLTRTPTYAATIKIIVGQQQKNTVPGQLANDVMGLQQVTETMVEVLPTRPVAQAVVDRLNSNVSANRILGGLSVQQVGATQVIEVTYQDESPQEAKQIANAVGAVFSERVSEVSPEANSITATVWEPAALPQAPISPNIRRDAMFALILGGMLGVGLAFLFEQLDTRWRSPAEVERVSGAPTFGAVPKFEGPKRKKVES